MALVDFGALVGFGALVDFGALVGYGALVGFGALVDFGGVCLVDFGAFDKLRSKAGKNQYKTIYIN
jgi:carbonic anhydrase/acetyltransferase-like protein (isoleucine patch superfamily)